MLRSDLEEIANFFDDRTYLTLNTTGDGLTNDRARALRDSGIFAIGVSLDSTDPNEHDRLRGKKGAHYEGGMRVPFIAAWVKADGDNPHQGRLRIPAGAIQSQQAAVYDLFPTILAAAGIESPPGHVVDGLRLDTLLTGQRDAGRPETFLMHYPHSPHRTNHFTCYRDGAWKVIYHYFPTEVSGGSRYQLFNLAEDPFEQTNLAASRPEQLRRMMQDLIAALEKHDAVYPVGKDGQVQEPVR